MADRSALIQMASHMAAMGPILDLIHPTYQPRAVADDLRRVAAKPSKSKRAKVKAARKQRLRNG
jgi:hypothetical protein